MVAGWLEFRRLLAGHCSWMRAAIVGSVLTALLSVVSARAADPYVVQHGFDGTDGLMPTGVVSDNQGNEYGVTALGGTVVCPEAPTQGCGVLYKINSGGNFQVLVTFTGGSNGANPLLKLAVKGEKIYGSAQSGGAFGGGLLFSVRTDGTHFNVLHNFGGLDGLAPGGDLAVDSSGDIFGTTESGGPGYSSQSGTAGDGVLFEITPDGVFQQLHDFTAAVDGSAPRGVILDKAGNLYGTTLLGAVGDAGTVYKFELNSGSFTTLEAFPAGGQTLPYVSSVGPTGNVYGYLNSYQGGQANGYYGALFVLTNGSKGYRYKVLYNFTGGADGAYPVGLALTAPHQMIGFTRNSSFSTKPQRGGTIFSYAAHTLTTLYNFAPPRDGRYPDAAPSVTKSGVVLGTTMAGGPSCALMAGGCGVVFQYTP